MKIMEEKQVEQWKDLENMEENTDKKGKIWKKDKLNNEKI